MPLWGAWTPREGPTCGPFCEPSSHPHLLSCPPRPLLRPPQPSAGPGEQAAFALSVCCLRSVVREAAEGRAEEAVGCLRRQVGGRGREQQPRWVRKRPSLQTCEPRQGPVRAQLTTSQGLTCTDLCWAVSELIAKDTVAPRALQTALGTYLHFHLLAMWLQAFLQPSYLLPQALPAPLRGLTKTRVLPNATPTVPPAS